MIQSKTDKFAALAPERSADETEATRLSAPAQVADFSGHRTCGHWWS